MRALSNKYHQYLWKSDFPRYGRENLRKHNDFVRNIVPPERLLEFQVKEGWRLLVESLGVKVPEAPFPRGDDWAEYKSIHKS